MVSSQNAVFEVHDTGLSATRFRDAATITAQKNGGSDDSVTNLRFIDLFAGLGGFHQALTTLGHKCVFACEIDSDLSRLYELNFGLRPHGDIRSLDISSVPSHDILCAGFPCQPFSKAGNQRGLECPQWGDLFDYVIQILRAHRPQYLIIENVPNLVRHRQGTTWRTIENRLRRAGYGINDKLLSPHQFGTPQIRKRAFIVGRRGGLKGFHWPAPPANRDCQLNRFSTIVQRMLNRSLLPLFDTLRHGRNS